MRPDLQSVATAFVDMLLTNADARNAYASATTSHDDAAAARVVDRYLSPTPPIAAADMPDLSPLIAAGLAAKGAAQSEVAMNDTNAPRDVGGSSLNVFRDTATGEDEADPVG